VRFQVLTAASMKIGAFWNIAQCSLVGVDRRFIGARLHGAIYLKAIIFIHATQGRGVHVMGVSAAYTFKLNKNILSA
jgi:hypothetical protein